MLAALGGMSVVMFSWLGLAGVFTGLGCLWYRPGRLPQADPIGVSQCFWLGWSVVVVGLQLWQVWLPVNGLALLAVTLAGGVGLVRHRQQLRRALSAPFRGRRLFLSVVALLLLWVANHSLRPPQNIDSGLYHLQAIRWIGSYPIVPGLGNLHGRLAFNNSYFLYPALLEAGPWVARSSHVANSLLVAVFLAVSLWCAFQVPRATGPRQLSLLYRAFFLAPVLDKVYRYNLSSPSPDLAVLLLGAVISASLLDLGLAPPASPAERTEVRRGIVFLAAVGVTLKLSFLPLGLGMGGLALVLGQRRPGVQAERRSPARVVLPLLALVFIPWLLRGVMASGYPLYPLTMGGVAVDWQVPAEQARLDADWIKGYARAPDQDYREVLDNWRWLGPWVRRLPAHYDVAVPLVLVGVMLAAAGLGRRRPGGPGSGELGLLLIPPLAGMVFWFLTAPDPRLVGAAVWIAAGVSLVLLLRRSAGASLPGKTLVVMGALYLAVAGGPLFRHLTLVGPGPDHGLHPTPAASVVPYVTASGLVLQVPRERGLCWDSPLPCTPLPSPDLQLRAPGDLGRGFRRAPATSGHEPQPGGK